MNLRKAITLVVGFLFITVLIALFVQSVREERQQWQAVQREALATIKVTPIDRGNGVFYFPAKDEAFIRSLVTYYESGKSRHCDLQGFTERVVNRNRTDARIEASGFILHCHDIAVEAQSITIP